jgi:GTP-binding protein HflX
MVEHAVKRDRALVAHPRFADIRAADADYDLDEAIGLAEALGVDPVSARIIPIRDIRSSNFFGAPARGNGRLGWSWRNPN